MRDLELPEAGRMDGADERVEDARSIIGFSTASGTEARPRSPAGLLILNSDLLGERAAMETLASSDSAGVV